MNFVSGMAGAVALAFPFLFSYTHAPLTNFWPLMCAWLCAGLLVLLLAWQAHGAGGLDRRKLALQCAVGVLLAALLGSLVGLLQYLGLVDAAWGWIPPSQPGVAMGQLRQRNQQATLLGMGLWTLWWLAAVKTKHTVEQPEGGGRWRSAQAMGVGLLLAWALALLAVGSAATASRTGLVQWLALIGLLVWWRLSLGWLPLVLAVTGLLLYAWAAWLLPDALLWWTGVRAEGLFQRFGEALDETSRGSLWANVCYLIQLKPWTGWGWGELDYAHYITLFPGTRFSVLLDNAHNLPLHLAVELGLPVALLFCAALAWWVWRAKPWAERDPVRQWAWGILALVGVHSMLEFPLWYGPFQVVTVLALGLLWRWPAQGPLAVGAIKPAPWAVAVLGSAALAVWLALAWQYVRVSQIYTPVAQRMPSMRDDPLAQVQGSWVFTDAIAFAELTTMPVNPRTATRVHALALRMLHYSPEPRVVERLIESATLLGLDDEAAFHLQRYRAAYPKAYEQWHAKWFSTASAER